MPIGLRHDRHTIACSLQGAPNHSRTKRGMIHIGVTREEDNIYIIPTAKLDLFLGSREEIRKHNF